MRSLHIDSGRIWRGGQRQCWLLCRALAAQGHETHLVCCPGTPLARRAAATAICLHTRRLAGELDLAAALRLADLLKRVRPDLVAAHDAHGHGLLALAAFLARQPAPLVFHRRVDVPLGRWFGARWKIARTRRFICVSRRIAEILADGGLEPARIRVVHDGIPALEIQADARERMLQALGLGSGVTLLGAVAGLIPHKGHRVLLGALAHLGAAERGLHLLVAGEGPLREALRAHAAALGLANVVHLLGERRDLELLFGALDLFVHPSLTEGLGSSILDAFAAGVPVVATRAGGIPELVTDGETGLLAPPGDAEGLAAALQTLLEDPAAGRRMAERARQVYQRAFTAEVMAEQTLVCYRELLGG